MSQFRSHCHWCGAPYSAEQVQAGPTAPRTCTQCQRQSWFNPTPISVLMQAVHAPLFPGSGLTKVGLLVGQRGITPKLGEWGLPGGFVDPADYSYEAASAREAHEEVALLSRPKWPEVLPTPKLWFSRPGDSGQLISFCLSQRTIPEDWLSSFQPCEECPQVRVIWTPETLCFPAHTEAAQAWFAEQYESALRRVA